MTGDSKTGGGREPPPEPRLGTHVSISGGLARMAEKAREFGLETVQIFSRSPRGGKARPLPEHETATARRLLRESDILPLVVHTPYFVNLCTTDEKIRAYGVETVAGELERAAALGSPYVVTHLGRPAVGTGLEGALDLAAGAVGEIFRRATDSEVMLLLENTAGAEREVGAALEELAEVVARLDRETGGRVGVCLDTCHAHVAGYDLSGPEGVAAFAGLARRLFGPVKVRVVHANDALDEAGSRRDRHAPIAEGTLGVAGFRALLTSPLLRGCPFLLETPGTDEDRVVGVTRLARLRAGLDLETLGSVQS